MTYINTVHGQVNLQATLSLSSAVPEPSPVSPHHPITCATPLCYHEDGSFSCSHVTVASDDKRTRTCVNHSIALLIIELAFKL